MFLARIYNFFSSMRLVLQDEMIYKNIEKQNPKVSTAWSIFISVHILDIFNLYTCTIFLSY